MNVNEIYLEITDNLKRKSFNKWFKAKRQKIESMEITSLSKNNLLSDVAYPGMNNINEYRRHLLKIKGLYLYIQLLSLSDRSSIKELTVTEEEIKYFLENYKECNVFVYKYFPIKEEHMFFYLGELIEDVLDDHVEFQKEKFSVLLKNIKEFILTDEEIGSHELIDLLISKNLTYMEYDAYTKEDVYNHRSYLSLDALIQNTIFALSFDDKNNNEKGFGIFEICGLNLVNPQVNFNYFELLNLWENIGTDVDKSGFIEKLKSIEVFKFSNELHIKNPLCPNSKAPYIIEK